VVVSMASFLGLGPMESEEGPSMFPRNDVNHLPDELPESHPGWKIFKAHVLMTKKNCLNFTHKYFTKA
jgi:hypothetical protein